MFLLFTKNVFFFLTFTFLQKNNNMSYEPKYIEQPVVSVHDSGEQGPMLVIHSYINQKGKMILSKDEASLLFLELYKFIENN